MSVDFRIIDFNYPFQKNVNIFGSSENVEYPASNAGRQIRSEVWRSSGYFVVTSSNNKIDFREVMAGPELTATLTEGNYGVSELAAEIKAQLEASSGNSRTYTVSQGGLDGKWTIESDGYLDLLFSSGSNFPSSLHPDIGFSDDDRSGSLAYTAPSTALHTEEGVVVDIKTIEEIDTFAVLFDQSLGINFSEEAEIYLQANGTNEWSSPALDIPLSVDNRHRIISHYFTTPESYRFWRLKVVDPRNPDLYVEVGTIILGKSTDLKRIPDNGFVYTKTDTSKVEENDFGNQYVDEYVILKELSFNMNIFTYETLQILEQVFDRVGIRVPIFVALDVQEDMYDKDNFAVYGRIDKSIKFKHRVTKYFAAPFRIKETM